MAVSRVNTAVDKAVFAYSLSAASQSVSLTEHMAETLYCQRLTVLCIVNRCSVDKNM